MKPLPLSRDLTTPSPVCENRGFDCCRLVHHERASGDSLLANKAWAGRFSGGTDRRVEQFTESISFDRRLFEQDIRGSIAHARMLEKVGLLSGDECGKIVQGLSEIRAEIEAGRFAFVLEREDIHMHVEAALIERL